MNLPSRMLSWDMPRGPVLHGFGSCIYADDWALPERTISDYEVFLMQEGEMRFWLDGRLFHLRRGDVLLFVPGQHQYGEIVPTGARTWSYHVHFDPVATPRWLDTRPLLEELARLGSAGRSPDVRFLPDADAQTVHLLERFPLGGESSPAARLFETGLSEQCDGRHAGRRMAELVLAQLLLLLTRRSLGMLFPTHAAARPQHPLIQKALGLMRQEIARPLAVADVAAALQVSPQHLMRVFRRETDATPLEHLTRLRLDRARELIRHTDLGLKEIARQTGFRHAHYFSRVFRRAEGMTPTAWRADVRRELSLLGSRVSAPRPSRSTRPR